MLAVFEMAGADWNLNYSSATTYSGAVQIAGDIGFNLSAHTGYTNNADLHTYNTLAADLCGTNGTPGTIPKRLVYESP
jgi:hypothetical protein